MPIEDYDIHTHDLIRREKALINSIFELTGNKGFIAGGFARYCLSEQINPIRPNDIDIFCQTEEIYNEILMKFDIAPKIHKRRTSEIEVKYDLVIEAGFHKESYSIQLIKPTEIFNMISNGDPIRILDNFDFSIAKCAIDPFAVYLFKDFYKHDAENRLVIYNIHCPISTMKRVLKYTLKGFEIESVELLKLFEDYEARDDMWKDIVGRGLRAGIDPTSKEYQRFIQTMYFD